MVSSSRMNTCNLLFSWFLTLISSLQQHLQSFIRSGRASSLSAAAAWQDIRNAVLVKRKISERSINTKLAGRSTVETIFRDQGSEGNGSSALSQRHKPIYSKFSTAKRKGKSFRTSIYDHSRPVSRIINAFS